MAASYDDNVDIIVEKGEEKEGKDDSSTPDVVSSNNSFFVYLLQAANSKTTYIGATVNLCRRLRQHNGEIKGGAKATRAKLMCGDCWQRVAYVTGFPTWQAALQFEWRWKHLSRCIPSAVKSCYKHPLQRRQIALQQLLKLPKSTSSAIPFAEWMFPPIVVIEPEFIDSFLTMYINV